MCDENKKECTCGCGEHDCDCEKEGHVCDHEGCDCGCEDDIVTLTMDNGKSYDFYSDGTIEYQGKCMYRITAFGWISGLCCLRAAPCS